MQAIISLHTRLGKQCVKPFELFDISNAATPTGGVCCLVRCINWLIVGLLEA